MKAVWLLLARHRDYRLLVGAGLVSALGDYVLGVGLTYLVYDLTGSTVASAAMLVVSVLPQVLLASAAGVLVDRWDRRRTLAVTYLLQVAVLAPLLVVTDDSRLWVLYLVAAAASVVEQLSTPAEQALVPHLVPVEELVPANAINGQSRNVARLVGSGLGGVTAAWGGLPALAVVDAGTFLVAAWLVLAIRTRAAETGAELALPTPWWVEWRAGLAVAAGSRTLRVLLLFTTATAVGEGVMGTLFPAFVRDVLDSDARGYGVVVGVQAIGGVVGGLLVAAFGARWRPERLLAAAAFTFGLLDLTLFLYPLVWVNVVPAVVLMVVVGLPGAAVTASFTTLMQLATTDAYRGRVFGTVLGLQSGGVLLGALLAGWLAEALGVVPVIAWQGAGYVALGLVVAVRLGRGVSAAPARRRTASR
jgi:MFS family permease